MDLLEYQAKRLFTTIGIPVLPSQSICKPGDLKNLHIPYPIVLKSQVRAVGRGKAGGVKFVENTIDAIAASQTIFKLPIEGEYPEVLLAEARYNAENEFFLAIMLDYHLKCPVLLGSSHGGMQIENLLKNMQVCVIEDEFSPFYARRLAQKMGLKGSLITSVSKILEKMYHLFWEKDLEIIEINPLGIDFNGEVMALDGKIRVNDDALSRHSDLLELNKNNIQQDLSLSFLSENQEKNVDQILSNASLFKLDENGDIAVISNSLDLGIVTHNLILEKKGKLGAFFRLDENLEYSLKEQLETIFEQIFNTTSIKFILINTLVNDIINQTIIEAINDFYEKELNNQIDKGEERRERFTGLRIRPQNVNKTPSTVKKIKPTKQIQWILRMVGDNLDISLKNLTDLPITLTDNLAKSVDLLLT
jgi:succinyl-CoA synthetase beta subunit